jgi:hypothetical protein
VRATASVDPVGMIASPTPGGGDRLVEGSTSSAPSSWSTPAASPVRYTGRGKESGASVDTEGAHLWTLREGKVIRLEVFSGREKALKAAGLSG